MHVNSWKFFVDGWRDGLSDDNEDVVEETLQSQIVEGDIEDEGEGFLEGEEDVL